MKRRESEMLIKSGTDVNVKNENAAQAIPVDLAGQVDPVNLAGPVGQVDWVGPEHPSWDLFG